MYHRDCNRRRGERTGPDCLQLRDMEGRMERGGKFQPGSTWIDHHLNLIRANIISELSGVHL